MDPLFEVVTRVSYQNIYALQKASVNNGIWVGKWVLLGLSIFNAALSWLTNQSDKWWDTALCLLVVVLVFFVQRLVAWLVYRGRNRGVEEMRFCFEEAGMRVVDAVAEGVIRYDGFVKLLENRGYYFLFIEKRAAYVLPKADFVQGDPQKLGAFLEEKTGKEVMRARG